MTNPSFLIASKIVAIVLPDPVQEEVFVRISIIFFVINDSVMKTKIVQKIITFTNLCLGITNTN